jgi:hypothetical protein
MKRLLPIMVVGVVATLAVGLVLQFTAPRLVSVEPVDGSENVPSRSNLRLNFSRRMDTDSVTSRLHISPYVAGTTGWQGRTLIFTPTEGWPGGAEMTITLDPGGQSAGILAQTMREGYQGVFRVSRPRLIYLFPANGPSNLFMIQPETGDFRALTDLASGILDYDASSSLNAIYFSMRNTQGGSNIYRISLQDFYLGQEDGQLPEIESVIACVQADCSIPRLSSRGGYLAFEKTEPVTRGGLGFPRVWVVPLGADGLASGEATLLAEADHQTVQPAWAQVESSNEDTSNPGVETLLIYDATLSAYVVYEIGQGQVASLPNNAGEIGSWAPGGKAYTAPVFHYLSGVLPDGTGEVGPVINSRLTRYDLTQTVAPLIQDLSQEDSVEDMLPNYSPDGSYLVFARRYLTITRWTPGRQIWIMPIAPDGSVRQPYALTDDPYFTHYDFSWSPNNQRLAYVRFNQTTLTEQPELWVINLQTFTRERLVLGAYAPQWFP